MIHGSGQLQSTWNTSPSQVIPPFLSLSTRFRPYLAHFPPPFPPAFSPCSPPCLSPLRPSSSSVVARRHPPSLVAVLRPLSPSVSVPLSWSSSVFVRRCQPPSAVVRRRPLSSAVLHLTSSSFVLCRLPFAAVLRRCPSLSLSVWSRRAVTVHARLCARRDSTVMTTFY